MKTYWKMFKILLALVIVAGTIFWAMDTVRSHSYDGTKLNLNVGSGPVSVMNPSNESVMVQLVGTGSSSFRVSSATEGISGSSTRQGIGRTSTQLFEFELPSGLSEFTVARGTNVNFLANTGTSLVATVQPVSADQSRAIILVAVSIVLGLLFYVSNATKHQWITILRRKFSPTLDESTEDTEPTPIVADTHDSSPMRAYGDNRVNIGD